MPPAVPPKPSSPNKRHVSPSQGSQSNRSIAANPGHKNSLAERARLVGALEGGGDRPSNTHFVSSARATLSPVPARKAVAREDEREPVQESGIVETSIKASSVIKQFETRKISKIKPDSEVFVEDQPAARLDA